MTQSLNTHNTSIGIQSVNNTVVLLCQWQTIDKPMMNGYLDWLSDRELEKYHRYKFDQDKQRFLIGRGLLRDTLSKLHPGVKPQQWVFQLTKKGKPIIDCNSHPNVSSHFSITHSGDWVGLALAPSPVGIDIEKMTDRQTIEAIAEHYFTEDEHLAVTKATNKNALFFRLWTLKEAYLKAQGAGLSGGLKSVSFNMNTRQIDIHKAANSNSRHWHCISAQLDDTHSFALAVNDQSSDLQYFSTDSKVVADYRLIDERIFNTT